MKKNIMKQHHMNLVIECILAVFKLFFDMQISFVDQLFSFVKTPFVNKIAKVCLSLLPRASELLWLCNNNFNQ